MQKSNLQTYFVRWFFVEKIGRKHQYRPWTHFNETGAAFGIIATPSRQTQLYKT